MTKKEYQRLRKIALKRIARLNKAGLSQRLISNYGGGKNFPTYTELKTDAKQFARAAIQVQSFLKAKTSTVTGAKASRKRTRTMLQKAGVKNVSDKKLELFGEFMKAARAAAEETAFDSDRAVSAFQMAQERKLDAGYIAENFDKWVKNNVDRKIEKRKTQVTSEEVEKYLVNQSGRNDKRSDRQNGRRVDRRRNTGSQKKKK